MMAYVVKILRWVGMTATVQITIALGTHLEIVVCFMDRILKILIRLPTRHVVLAAAVMTFSNANVQRATRPMVLEVVLFVEMGSLISMKNVILEALRLLDATTARSHGNQQRRV